MTNKPSKLIFYDQVLLIINHAEFLTCYGLNRMKIWLLIEMREQIRKRLREIKKKKKKAISEIQQWLLGGMSRQRCLCITESGIFKEELKGIYWRISPINCCILKLSPKPSKQEHFRCSVIIYFNSSVSKRHGMCAETCVICWIRIKWSTAKISVHLMAVDVAVMRRSSLRHNWGQ